MAQPDSTTNRLPTCSLEFVGTTASRCASGSYASFERLQDTPNHSVMTAHVMKNDNWNELVCALD